MSKSNIPPVDTAPGHTAPGKIPPFVALLARVRVPTQHGVFILALLSGAVLGALLAGTGRAEMSDMVPAWMPAAASSAAAVGAVVGSLTAGLLAWLICRPRRAQQWTIEYPQPRLISLRGVTQ